MSIRPIASATTLDRPLDRGRGANVHRGRAAGSRAPAATSSATTVSPASCERSRTAITGALGGEELSAISRPMPLPAPVTTASCPSGARRPPQFCVDGDVRSSIAHMESSGAREQHPGRSPVRATEGSPSPTWTVHSSSTVTLLGLELVWRGELPAPVIGRIVGVPEAPRLRRRVPPDPRQRDPGRAGRVSRHRQEVGRHARRATTARATSASSSRTSRRSTTISPRRASAFARTGRSR